MGCESNHFCASLNPDLRKQLCKGCHRQLLGEGSLQNYDSSRKTAIILIDGLIIGKGFGDETARSWPDVHFPRAVIVMPGFFANLWRLSGMKTDDMFASSYFRCITDCCVATFDHAFLENLENAYPEFMQAEIESVFESIVVSSEFLSIALTPSMSQKVEQLVAYLEQYDLYLSEVAIAKLLSCSRTTVSRAFTVIERNNPELLNAYSVNKKRPIILQNLEGK